MTQRPPLTFVDLFCGAGGLSLGFISAGWSGRLAIDSDRAAIATHLANLGKHARCECVTEKTEIPNVDAIIGGPPCQGFSSAGPRRTGDHRNSLVRLFSTLVSSIRPQAFLFENVEGFLTAEQGCRVFDLLEPLINAGYRIHLRKVNAADYGVPQHRKRTIAIGGLGWDPTFPSATHMAFGAPGTGKRNGMPKSPTLWDAIADLPLAQNNPPGIPQGHYCSAPSEADLRRIAYLKEGDTMRDLPDHLQHRSYERRANRRVMDGTPTERRGGPPAGIRRLNAMEPSKAITGAARCEFVHPKENRCLTLRECARIQAFPDDYIFLGTTADQLTQIGNAVPPHLARVFARSLQEDLQRNPRIIGAGALLSFVPTTSSGMSPALERVTATIQERFLSEERSSLQLQLWR